MDKEQEAARQYLRGLMDRHDLDATGLARRAGLAPSTLTRIMKGDESTTHTLSARTLAKLRDTFGEKTPSVVAALPRLVPVVGYVGAGEEVFPVPEDGDQLLEEVSGPSDLDDETVAVIVRGMSMFPAYWAGDSLAYTRAAGFDSSECLYKECVVKVVNGPTLVKMVMPGTRDGRFILTSYNAAPIIDAEIEWAAPVTFADKRRRRVRP